jgi:hypothetical protein
VFPDVEFAAVAEAFGFQVYTIRSLDDLRALGPVLGKPDGPSFWTARSTRTSPRPSWASSPNSKRDSTVDQEGRPLRVSGSVIVAAAIS